MARKRRKNIVVELEVLERLERIRDELGFNNLGETIKFLIFRYEADRFRTIKT